VNYAHRSDSPRHWMHVLDQRDGGIWTALKTLQSGAELNTTPARPSIWAWVLWWPTTARSATTPTIPPARRLPGWSISSPPDSVRSLSGQIRPSTRWWG
jgi:hypothetical protein